MKGFVCFFGRVSAPILHGEESTMGSPLPVQRTFCFVLGGGPIDPQQNR